MSTSQYTVNVPIITGSEGEGVQLPFPLSGPITVFNQSATPVYLASIPTVNNIVAYELVAGGSIEWPQPPCYALAFGNASGNINLSVIEGSVPVRYSVLDVNLKSGTIDANIVGPVTVETASGTTLDTTISGTPTFDLAAGASVDANITNASIDANIQNATLDVTGSTVGLAGGTQLTDSSGIAVQPNKNVVPIEMLGNGSDGAVTFSADTTLTGPIQATSIVFSNTPTITANGWPILCTGTISGTDATIESVGAGSGASPSISYPYPGGLYSPGGSGGNMINTVPAQPPAGGDIYIPTSRVLTTGGSGGSGGEVEYNPSTDVFDYYSGGSGAQGGGSIFAPSDLSGAWLSGGGGGGQGCNYPPTGSVTYAGGNGGQGGGVIFVACKQLDTTLNLTATGGGGGVSASNASAGGGGGGGGVCILLYGSLGSSGAVGTTDVTGGAGGGILTTPTVADYTGQPGNNGVDGIVAIFANVDFI